MRLSEWRAAAPGREAATARVGAVVDPVLLALGTEADPHCWIAWGDDPSMRYTILVPTAAGLVSCYVRVNQPGEGPRATAKLIRWNRLQLGELAVETQADHRLVTFQVEQQVLKGADVHADRVAAFALELFAAIDGRPMPVRREAPLGRRAAASRAAAARPGSAGAAKASKASTGGPAGGGAAGGKARSGTARTRPPAPTPTGRPKGSAS